MHTEKYSRLVNRLDKLRTVYLPSEFSPTGSYTDDDLEKVCAYKVLSHAEMEYYFEQIALEIVQKSFHLWRSSKRVSRPLLSLVAYYDGSFPALPDAHGGNNADKDLNWRVGEAVTKYNKQVRDKNHGIKEKNILSIFLPIGVETSDIDADMLRDLDNFGSERGTIAHSTRASTLTTPDDALNSVNNIMTFINPFDEFLATYRDAVV